MERIRAYTPLVREIAKREHWAQAQSEEEMQRYTHKLREAAGGASGLAESQIIDSCALSREAARRVLGERIYDVQLIGALSLHEGMVVEMRTGEGKTISSVPALYVNAISGRGVHVVTVNDYLAKRDALWMGGVFRYLGISSAYINSETGSEQRKLAYQADITYGTNNEFGFDYLRDNLCRSIEHKVQRGHHFCVIDEVDSILIDEARTPLIISGVAEDNTQYYTTVNALVRQLTECLRNESEEYEENAAGDYKLEAKNKHVSFTEQGMEHIEQLLLQKRVISDSLYSGGNFEFVHYITQAVRAQQLYARDTDYVVKDNQVQIVDEFTGRILKGRRYSDGLHQAIEAKEGIPIARKSKTIATITLQNYFRQYKKIAGMTGTAATEAKELGKIYGLQVAVIPTNRPIIRADHNDLIYPDEAKKHAAILKDVMELHANGQPILLGTTTIEKSELLSQLFARHNLPHTVLNAKNHSREAEIIAQAGRPGGVTIATNMAGRGTDIKLGGDPKFISNSEMEQAGGERGEGEGQGEQEHPEYLEQVRERGGLYVIGTERHDSRRIDNQLRGRSGRQGDPGASKFYISLDDQLMRLFGERRQFLKSVIERGLEEGEALNHPLINKSIAKAQTRVEERNFEIRKHLLEFDDVINEQRSIVYAQRDEILTTAALSERLLTTVSLIAEQECAEYKRQQDSGQRDHALKRMSEILLIESELYTATDKLPHDYASLLEYIKQYARADLQHKERLFSSEQWNFAIQQEYIRQIDSKWQDHLESLDALREAVYLRSYAQKNPLLEYKIEGFQLFDHMIEEIRLAVAKRFFAIRVRQEQQVPEIRVRRDATAVTALSSQHRSFRQFENIGQVVAAGQQAAARSATARSVAPRPSSLAVPTVTRAPATAPGGGGKVGRNDPCPCGSGKKYKYCHGK